MPSWATTSASCGTGEAGVEVDDVGAELGRGDEAEHEDRGGCGRGCRRARRADAASRAARGRCRRWPSHSSAYVSGRRRRSAPGRAGSAPSPRRSRRPSSGPTRPSPTSPGAGGRVVPGAARRGPARCAAASDRAAERHQLLLGRRARGRRRRPCAIVAHSGSTKCASTSRSWTSPAWLRTWSLSSPSASNPRLREHRHRRLLLGDDLDDELGHAQLDGLDDGPLGEQAAEAAPAVLGVDDEAQLADVAAPADAADDGPVAGDLTVDDGDQPALAGVGDPALDDAGLEDVLAEERAVALGDAGEERRSGIGVAGRDGADLDLGAGRSAGPRIQRLPVAASQSAIAGRLWRWAVRPTTRPTCPAGRRSSSTSVEPTRLVSSPSTPAGRCGPSRR